MSEYNTILLAVVGTSPAILTETIWALINSEEPIIPNKIVVLTTTEGKRVLTEQLLDSGIWDKFIVSLKDKHNIDTSTFLRFGSSESLHVFPSADGKGDLTDITTAKDNESVANYIIEKLRIYSEDPDIRIIASIAGGRKTMGTLLSLGMTLLGREQDRLCHVLVSSPYEKKLEPSFFYPEQNAIHQVSKDEKVKSADAKISLIDIPFVRTKKWKKNNLVKAGTSYMSLVEQFKGGAPLPEVHIDMQKGTIFVNETNISLSSTEFAVLVVFLADRLKAEGRLLEQKELADKLEDLSNAPENAKWFHDFEERLENKDLVDTIKQNLSAIRTKLVKAGFGDEIIKVFIPSGRYNTYNYPIEKFTFENGEWYDDLPVCKGKK